MTLTVCRNGFASELDGNTTDVNHPIHTGSKRMPASAATMIPCMGTQDSRLDKRIIDKPVILLTGLIPPEI